jgi:4-hydroxy-4-methyl-2-oxoglutarate aldolase
MKATSWRDDEETFRLLKEELLTAVIGCVLELKGYRRQFLSATIGPLQNAMKIARRASPSLEANIFDGGRSQSAGSVACKAFAILWKVMDPGSSSHFQSDVKSTLQ